MTTRRTFIKKSLMGTTALSMPMYFGACTSDKQIELPKISLAQWSLNRAIRKGEIKPEDFAAITKNTYGLDAVEYVATFYLDQKYNAAYWGDLKKRSDSEGVNNLLIMIDEQGDLGAADEDTRLEAVDDHKVWVDNAASLGCHSIRVNAFGAEDRQTIKAALVDGLGDLCDYGSQAGINIIIENHGLYSSDADFIVEVIKEVDSPFMGTLPDFGNWCTSVKWGVTSDDSCETVYNQVKGVKEFMPYNRGVSAKTYDFNAQGGQDRVDFKAILQVVKDHGFDGYIGIEYEGNNLSEEEGIKATKALIHSTWAELH